MKCATKAIHVGSEPNLESGDVVIPIHLSTTFARKDVAKPTAGYEYSRTGNPTRSAVEKNLAALENARFAFAFASGLSAITTVLFLLKKGDHILSIDDVYGGTRRLFDRVFTAMGLEFSYLHFTTSGDIADVIRPNTKMIWVESPTNPLLKIIDIASITHVKTAHRILTVVDNTFASPVFQNPLDLNADLVVHSLTKYIGGHSDVIGGCAMTNDEELAHRVQFLQNAVGAILSPFDSYQVLKGAKTLPMRMQKHEENAQAIVSFLQEQKRVKKIFYPGLPSHPNHTIAKKQMKGFGGMISFEIHGTYETAKRFLESLQLFAIAESLGAVESLIEHPASMTHAAISQDQRERIGISDTLIRISTGIEDSNDLITDLSRAFERTE